MLSCGSPVKQYNILRGFEMFEENRPSSENKIDLQSLEFIYGSGVFSTSYQTNTGVCDMSLNFVIVYSYLSM